uniref:Uncharacterized protein n=1 Tax=Arundo donax TaxID=35708 RepID=A0A0A9E4B9_ARUDO
MSTNSNGCFFIALSIFLTTLERKITIFVYSFELHDFCSAKIS